MRNRDKTEALPKKKSRFKKLAIVSTGIAAASALFVAVRKHGATQ